MGKYVTGKARYIYVQGSSHRAPGEEGKASNRTSRRAVHTWDKVKTKSEEDLGIAKVEDSSREHSNTTVQSRYICMLYGQYREEAGGM